MIPANVKGIGTPGSCCTVRSAILSPIIETNLNLESPTSNP